MNQGIGQDAGKDNRSIGNEVARQAVRLELNKHLFLVSKNLPRDVVRIFSSVRDTTGCWLQRNCIVSIDSSEKNGLPSKKLPDYSATEIFVVRNNGYYIAKIRNGEKEIDLKKIVDEQPSPERRQPSVQTSKTTTPTSFKDATITTPSEPNITSIPDLKLVLILFARALPRLQVSFLQLLGGNSNTDNSKAIRLAKQVDKKLGELANYFLSKENHTPSATLLQQIIQYREKGYTISLQHFKASSYPNLDAVATLLFKGGIAEDSRKYYKPLENAINTFIQTAKKPSVFVRVRGLGTDQMRDFETASALKLLLDNNYFADTSRIDKPGSSKKTK